MKENLVEEESLILINKDNKIPDDYKPQLVYEYSTMAEPVNPLV